ncbi:MAG TPA: selenium-binding protein SBP56-related protein [Gemmatimonadaceae bacterium]|nr:selenium-binding protein SBP56-related protein [Gemmatimonadaceae bacterium]
MSATLTPPRKTMLPDPTFYPSPRAASAAPPETLAYVMLLNPTPGDGRPDSIGVVDCDPKSKTHGEVVTRVDLPYAGDELHHFGWNACSAALCPYAPHPHVRRRYLVVPGLRSSRIYIVDTQPNPLEPSIVRIIEPDELISKTGYSRPHTVHCGPDGIYMSALGNANGDAPGGVFVLDHDTFEPLGAWEIDRGPQRLAYDFWWHLGYDTMVTSEWGTPKMVENGLDPELLMAKKYGQHLNFWDLRKRRHLKSMVLGEENQMVLELRPAHDPTRAYGFAGVVVSLENLSSSIWLWFNRDGDWQVQKVIEIPAEPADPDQLPPALKDFKAVPPLVTDIALSLDDRSLYASCWGTGELRRYDVSDPFQPKHTGSVQLGGIVRRTEFNGSGPLNGGPQMLEVSRDGKRVYLTNSLYSTWDAQFYPEGVRGWITRLNVGPDGQMAVDPDFFVTTDGYRPHQVHLQGGDASSDSYCFA